MSEVWFFVHSSIALNGNKEERSISTARFAESIGSFKNGKDVVTKADVDLQNLKIPGLGTFVLELR